MMHQTAGAAPCRVEAVLVIDDHPLYGDALASALFNLFDGCQVKTATSLCDGLKLLGTSFRPDLVMLDLKLPDATGISGFLQVREKLPDVPILVISSLASGDVIAAVMAAGAAGFVPKDLPVQKLREALYQIRKGQQFLPSDYKGVQEADSEKECDFQQASRKIAALTPQQMRIMKLICAGMANKQIAYEMSLAEATVKAHITALLRRLGAQNRTQAAMMMESARLDQNPPSDATATALHPH